MDFEIRSIGEVRALDETNGLVLTGLAIPYNKLSENLGGFRETILPGAAKRTVDEGGEVLADWEHSNVILGRRSMNTLKLSEEADGIHFTLELPDNTTGRDLAVSIRRGDYKACSFRMYINKQQWRRGEGNTAVREITDLSFDRVTITCQPAYPDTSVALRSLEKFQQEQEEQQREPEKKEEEPHTLSWCEAMLKTEQMQVE